MLRLSKPFSISDWTSPAAANTHESSVQSILFVVVLMDLSFEQLCLSSMGGEICLS